MPRLLASDLNHPICTGVHNFVTYSPEISELTAFLLSLRRDRFKKAVKFRGNTADSGGAFAVLFGEIFSK